MVLFTPVIVLLDTVRVPVFHKGSVLPEVDPLVGPDVVVDAGTLVEPTDPAEEEMEVVWLVLEVDVQAVSV